MNSSASARASISHSRSSTRRRISAPSTVPPGSRRQRCGIPAEASESASRRSWVDFPEPSPPSKTIRRPSCATTSAECDDGAGRALLDAVDDPVVHARHQLVEVLLRRDEALVDHLALHLPEERVEILLHLLRRTLATLDHLLGVHAELFHLLQQRHGCRVLPERVVRAPHSLILGALSDHSSEFLGLVLDHSAPRRLATTNRSRPVRSSTTCTISYAPFVAISSAATDARRESTSSASTPLGASAAAASRTRRAVTAMPAASLNSATGGSQSLTLAGSASRSPHEM